MIGNDVDGRSEQSIVSGVSYASSCYPGGRDALYPFSPTRTHAAIHPDEKYDVLTRNDALLSARK
jgi:hypothetical protein